MRNSRIRGRRDAKAPHHEDAHGQASLLAAVSFESNPSSAMAHRARHQELIAHASHLARARQRQERLSDRRPRVSCEETHGGPIVQLPGGFGMQAAAAPPATKHVEP